MKDTQANMALENQTMATISFTPKKTFGQWMLRSATLEVNHVPYKVKIGKTIDICVTPGMTDLICYGNYLGKMGTVHISEVFEAGKRYEVRYKAPMLVFLSGKLSVHPL